MSMGEASALDSNDTPAASSSIDESDSFLGRGSSDTFDHQDPQSRESVEDATDGGDAAAAPRMQGAPSDLDRVYICQFGTCGKKYSNTHSRRQHYRRQHKEAWDRLVLASGRRYAGSRTAGAQKSKNSERSATGTSRPGPLDRDSKPATLDDSARSPNRGGGRAGAGSGGGGPVRRHSSWVSSSPPRADGYQQQQQHDHHGVGSASDPLVHGDSHGPGGSWFAGPHSPPGASYSGRRSPGGRHSYAAPPPLAGFSSAAGPPTLGVRSMSTDEILTSRMPSTGSFSSEPGGGGGGHEHYRGAGPGYSPGSAPSSLSRREWGLHQQQGLPHSPHEYPDNSRDSPPGSGGSRAAPYWPGPPPQQHSGHGHHYYYGSYGGYGRPHQQRPAHSRGSPRSSECAADDNNTYSRGASYHHHYPYQHRDHHQAGSPQQASSAAAMRRWDASGVPGPASGHPSWPSSSSAASYLSYNPGDRGSGSPPHAVHSGGPYGTIRDAPASSSGGHYFPAGADGWRSTSGTTTVSASMSGSNDWDDSCRDHGAREGLHDPLSMLREAAAMTSSMEDSVVVAEPGGRTNQFASPASSAAHTHPHHQDGFASSEARAPAGGSDDRNAAVGDNHGKSPKIPFSAESLLE